jgi:hypothetical protein
MIVGLLGFIGSGKGTAGRILKEVGFQPISFASGVKDVASVMFGWRREWLEGDTDDSRMWREEPDEFWSKKFGRNFTPREALQKLGTEVGREIFDKNFWVDRLEKYIESDQNYVVTDCRFYNEIQFIHDRGGILIEIERGVHPHWYNIAARANRGNVKEINYMHNESGVHPSEWSWIGGNIDHVVVNNGTVEDLRQNLLKCLTKSYGANTIHELTQGAL